jgi:hypothetical protein
MNQPKEITMKQIRLWVLHIPLPKIPPVILAVLPITDGIKSEALANYCRILIDGLARKGIWVISYACDGTEKERAAQ